VNFLIDTNVVIPLEPTSRSEVKQNTLLASQFAGQVAEGGHSLYIHPEINADISRDPDVERRTTLQILIKKYQVLPDPPSLTQRIITAFGVPPRLSNDWVDIHLLAALDADAVDILVTEDRGIRTKAAQLGLQPRVATIAEALSIIRDLYKTAPNPPPSVREIRAHNLDSSDPIFQSLRSDYPGFDAWLVNAKREQRRCWVVYAENSELAAISIVKPEYSKEFGLPGQLLKICTFKVSEDYNGFRYGELLLKAILSYVDAGKFDYTYLTVFEKHQHLIALMQDFGFKLTSYSTDLGELVLAKPPLMSEQERANLSSLDFNINFGPHALKYEGTPVFVVPIQPSFHSSLFPDAEQQRALFPRNSPFGNAMRKAYLCNSANRQLATGDILLFYRSQDYKSVTGVGVTEDTLVSRSAIEIARFVGKRTVYKYSDIEDMCQKDVLAILFSRVLK